MYILVFNTSISRWIFRSSHAQAGDELRLHVYVGAQRQVLPHMAPAAATATAAPFLGATVNVSAAKLGIVGEFHQDVNVIV